MLSTGLGNQTLCFGSVSVAMVKHPDRQQHRGGRLYSVDDSMFQPTAEGKSRPELNKHLHPCWLAGAELPFSARVVQGPTAGTNPHRRAHGRPNVDNPKSLRLPSQPMLPRKTLSPNRTEPKEQAYPSPSPWENPVRRCQWTPAVLKPHTPLHPSPLQSLARLHD